MHVTFPQSLVFKGIVIRVKKRAECEKKEVRAHECQTAAHTCNPRTWEGKARSAVQGPPQLHGEFEASLSYMGPSLKNNTKSTFWGSVEVAQWLMITRCSCGGPGFRVRGNNAAGAVCCNLCPGADGTRRTSPWGCGKSCVNTRTIVQHDGLCYCHMPFPQTQGTFWG